MTITDREAFSPVSLGIEIAVALRDLFSADWDLSKFEVLLANQRAFELLRNGATAEEVIASWQKELAGFRARAAGDLLYEAGYLSR